MSDERRVHEVLVKARNLIERDGFVQGLSCGLGGGYCTRGAMSVAAGGCPTDRPYWPTHRPSCPPLLAPALAAFEAQMSPEMRADVPPHSEQWCGGCLPEMWSERPGRTKQEVLAAFDRAIATTAPEPDTSFLSNPEQSPSPDLERSSA